MSEVWSSFSKWFNEKTGSPVYFTYIGFFVAWNWRFFQLVFLEDSNLFSSPRIEYLFQKITLSSGVSGLAGRAVDLLLNLSWKVIPPAILTWFAIMYLPAVHRWALSKYLDSLFDRKKLYKNKEKEYTNWLTEFEKQQARSLESLATVKKTQTKSKRIIEELTTPEEKKKREFEKIKNSPLYSRLNELKRVIYENGGATHVFSGSSYVRTIGADILALAHTNDLISIEGRERTEKIQLTPKGKEFMAWYFETGSN
ncbi:MAG TPA: hypothetical protein VF679_06745 [Pedobacter sp.]